MYQYVLVYTGLYSYVLVHTSMYYTYFLHIYPAGIYGYKLEHTRMSILVHSHTALYPLVLFWIQGGTRRYKAVKSVQGGTRQYPKVPYPWIVRYKEVHDGTKALYLLVPYYPGVLDFWVLPCTAWYRLVSRRGQGGMRENQNLRNMLVCTSTYLYILVHTDSYQSCESM